MRRADGDSPIVGESAVGPVRSGAGPPGSGGAAPSGSVRRPQGTAPALLTPGAPAPQLRYSEYRGVDR